MKARSHRLVVPQSQVAFHPHWKRRLLDQSTLGEVTAEIGCNLCAREAPAEGPGGAQEVIILFLSTQKISFPLPGYRSDFVNLAFPAIQTSEIGRTFLQF